MYQTKVMTELIGRHIGSAVDSHFFIEKWNLIARIYGEGSRQILHRASVNKNDQSGGFA
jgi:hypothetical protein